MPHREHTRFRATEPSALRALEERDLAADRYCLVFVRGAQVVGLRVPLEDAEVVLGRDPGCEVPLPFEDVSRHHARLVPDRGGHVLVDLGSTNGTWVNGVEVRSAKLTAGDRLQLGSCVARYLRAGDAEERELVTLAELARKDALTGLPNRRAFEEALAREIARVRRIGGSLSALVMDVDHFKRVNDDHGHAGGDAVLAQVAARTRAALRAEDFLARVGGEELAVLLPGTTLRGALDAGERVRTAIERAPFAPRPDVSIALTASLGCAAAAGDEADGADLVARADARLYEAKRAGRNRVIG